MRRKRLLIIFGIFMSLTLLIALGSAVFSIKKVDAFCYNLYDEDCKELDKKVLAETDKLLGRSVFSLNEAKLIQDVEDRVGGIRVVNIERMFPDRVSINYVKLYDYFEVAYDGSYYISAIDGVITDKRNESSGENVISIRLNLADKPEVGGTFAGAKHFESLQNMITMLERLDIRETDATTIIKTIDLSYSNFNIYIQTRGGVLIKLINMDGKNEGEKLRAALSLYWSKQEYRTSGMITVTNGTSPTYSKEKDNIYEESYL